MPVREEAIKAIGTRSLAIDIYIWLAYRLHALPKITAVSWTAIHAQFGAGFRLVRQIKPTFMDALAVALLAGAREFHDIQRSSAVYCPSTLPVVATARHAGSLCLNLLANWGRAWLCPGHAGTALDL